MGLGEKTDAVIAEYQSDANTETAENWMIIKYPDAPPVGYCPSGCTPRYGVTGVKREFVAGEQSTHFRARHTVIGTFTFYNKGDALCAVFSLKAGYMLEKLLNDVLNCCSVLRDKYLHF